MIGEQIRYLMRKSWSIRKKERFVAYFTKENPLYLSQKKLRFLQP